jgi:hypothetical protein
MENVKAAQPPRRGPDRGQEEQLAVAEALDEGQEQRRGRRAAQAVVVEAEQRAHGVRRGVEREQHAAGLHRRAVRPAPPEQPRVPEERLGARAGRSAPPSGAHLS